jgi:L,D-peptidoglycan transpeptidase YkuD (ErfK/YbiS/YcfS/YnhG family)
MRARRALISSAAVGTVLLCAVAVIAASKGIKPRAVADVSTPSPSASSSSAASPDSSDYSGWSSSPASPSVAPTTSNATSAPPAAATVTSTTAAVAAAHAAPPTTSSSSHAVAPPAPPAPTTGQALPVSGATGSATEVITVVAASTASTTATLQAWTKAPGGGWLKHGSAVTAHVGSAGLTTHASESLSATPIGSFTLTRAFGRDANPGTAIPYHVTSPSDWWISQPGSLYNTMQTCSGSCSFTQGNPNEHLYYETPYYNYAVVIDYNTGPVVQGAGSAFFLHVTDGAATAGCVAIPQANLVSIMQWLTPADSPRILIGVA